VGASLRCAKCAAVASRRWSKETIVAAIREWAAQHDGAPPKARDWHQSEHVHPDYRLGRQPAMATVRGYFPRFNAAVEAAGFEPYRRHGGQPRKPLSAAQLAETAALVEELGLTGAAERLGIGREAVKRRLKQHRGEPVQRQGGRMALSAEEVLDREAKRCEQRLEHLKEEIVEIERTLVRLARASEVLAEDGEKDA
jgi:hypothetical protein